MVPYLLSVLSDLGVLFTMPSFLGAFPLCIFMFSVYYYELRSGASSTFGCWIEKPLW